MLIGEGKCYYNGRMQDTAKVFKALQIQPTTLASKEGLALLNGTQFTLAHAMMGVPGSTCHEVRQPTRSYVA